MTPLCPEIHPFKPARTVSHDEAEMLELVYGLGLTIREVGFVLMKAAKEKAESGGIPPQMQSVQTRRKPRDGGAGHGLKIWGAE